MGLCSPGFSQTQFTFSRGGPPIKVELAGFGLGQEAVYGDDDRTYEHATVAVNDNLDILVAFNSDRNDLPPPFLKQVEVAYYQYLGAETWEFRETRIVGSIDYAPLTTIPFVSQTTRERPDIIAVKDKFFVVWTRNYPASSSPPSTKDEPALLECAWIDIVQGTSNKEMEIYAYPGSVGRGWQLDFDNPGTSNFHVRESKGVPDAVYLNDPADPYKVAVVYAHQNVFFDEPLGSTARDCELRVVTCSLDTTGPTPVILDTDPETIETSVAFNGPSASTGIVLPDLAPSGEDNAFWLTAESQEDFGTGVDGVILLGYWKYNGSIWSRMAYRTIRTFMGTNNLVRRRPMISSYPEGARDQTVALTYGEVDPDADPLQGEDDSANVILKFQTYAEGTIGPPPPDPESGVSYGAYFQWPNTNHLSDAKPVVVSGRQNAGIQYCFADELGAPGQSADCKIQVLNQADSPLDSQGVPILETAREFAPAVGDTLGRPAAAYAYYPMSSPMYSPDYVALTWEESQGGSPLSVYLTVLAE